MSLGIFSLILIAALVMLGIDHKTRGRIVFASLCALMLGLVIAGSNGVLVEPARALVDGVRDGLTSIGHSLGGGKVTAAQLARIRWGVRGALLLGVATSVAANVLHAQPNPISQAIAAWPPLALLLTVELISRIPVHQRTLAVVRLTATAFIAAIAAWVSYWHMAGVAARYGEIGAAPYLIPLSVDGLVVVASVCLVELAGRISALAAAPVIVADTSPDVTADTIPDTSGAPDRKPAVASAKRPLRRRDTAKAVARLRGRHPDLPTGEIARRLGVTDRTVRRHLSAATS